LEPFRRLQKRVLKKTFLYFFKNENDTINFYTDVNDTLKRHDWNPEILLKWEVLTNDCNAEHIYYFISLLSLFHASCWRDINSMFTLLNETEKKVVRQIEWFCTPPINFIQSLPINLVLNKEDMEITRYIESDNDSFPPILKEMGITILDYKINYPIEKEIKKHIGLNMFFEENPRILIQDDLNGSIESLNLSLQSRSLPSKEDALQVSLVSMIIEWASSKLYYSDPIIVDPSNEKIVNIIFHNWYGRESKRKLIFNDDEIKRVTENFLLRKTIKYEEIVRVRIVKKKEWMLIFEYTNSTNEHYSAEARDIDWIRRYLIAHLEIVDEKQ